MNYLPRNRSPQQYFKKIRILIAIFILCSLVFYFTRGIVISVVSPIWKTKNVLVSGENVTPIIDRHTESGMIVSTVLTYPPQTPYDTIIIDAGSSNSIISGSEVSMPEGPILGRVTEVFSKTAKVRLFSSNGEKTTAILERNNVPLTLTGAGGGNFKIELSRDVHVEIGDRILSPNMSPRLLAVVGEVSSEPTDSFKKVLARGPANIFSLRFVFVRP